MRTVLIFFGVLVTLSFAETPMTKITVHVTDTHDKPVPNAAVIIRFVSGHSIIKLGRGTKTEWEVRSGQEGQVTLPTIPQGKILIQVIAKGYQTYGENVDIDEVKKTVEVVLKPPQAQYTAH
jgi:hypothetical protein